MESKNYKNKILPEGYYQVEAILRQKSKKKISLYK